MTSQEKLAIYTLTPSEKLAMYKKLFWKILPLLVICNVVSYLDRINLSFAKLQMNSELQFSDAVYGLGAGIFFVGYVIAEVPSNLMLHRFGARRWIARILVTWGILSAAMALTSSPTSFYILRFLLGIAEAGFFPGALYYLMQWVPSERRTHATSILYLGAPLAGLIGGPLSGFIINGAHGFAGLSGWQWMFVLEALPAVILGIIVFLCLHEKISEVNWLSANEKAYLTNTLEAEATAKGHIPLKDIFRNKNVLFFGFVLFLLVMGLYGIYFWLPTMVKESGVQDPFHIGLMTSLPYAVAIAAMLIVGRMADKRGDRRLYLLTTLLLGASAFVVAVTGSGNTVIVLGALSVATACSMVMLPLFYSFPPALLTGLSAAGGIALINSIGVSAGFLAPYMVGALRDLTGSPATGMYVLAACWTTAGLLALRFPKITKHA